MDPDLNLARDSNLTRAMSKLYTIKRLFCDKETVENDVLFEVKSTVLYVLIILVAVTIKYISKFHQASFHY